jgi:hypothetical protein
VWTCTRYCTAICDAGIGGRPIPDAGRE